MVTHRPQVPRSADLSNPGEECGGEPHNGRGVEVEHLASDPCPLCSYAGVMSLPSLSGGSVACPKCGNYDIDWDFLDGIDVEVRGEKRFLLSILTRQASANGRRIRLTKEHLKSWQFLKKPDPVAVIDTILAYIRGKVESVTDKVDILPTRDYPLFGCKDSSELAVLLDVAQSRHDYLTRPAEGQYTLTVKGWERAAQLGPVQNSTQAFVAHWFKEDIQAAFEHAMIPALRESGWEPRDLAFEHNKKICDMALAEIRKSGLVVADCTGHRPSVYYEAGFAQGLNIPVIFTCRKDYEKKRAGGLAFDTRQYNHVIWNDEEDLHTKLRARVQGTHPGPGRTDPQ